MATDEALLDAARGDPDRAPVLRLYGWSRVTLSYGRGQAFSETLERRAAIEGVVERVRRPTGGRAVLHDRERTFSVVGSLDRPPFANSVRDVYAAVRRAVDRSLALLGVPVESGPGRGPVLRRGSAPSRERGALDREACFRRAEAHEPHSAGRKLAGLAQVRRGRAFLVQGSIPLAGAGSSARLFELDPTVCIDLESAIGAPIRIEDVDRAWFEGFGRTFGIEWFEARWSPIERRTRERHAVRHAHPKWIRCGRSADVFEPGPAAVNP